MNALRIITFFALLACAGLASAQAPSGDEGRGSTPPGTSRDGSGPADGALKGGSIAPGESSGVPDNRPGAPADRDRATRCEDLTGALREQCLLNGQDAGSGGTRPGDSVITPNDAGTRPPGPDRNLRKNLGPAPDVRG